jgi:hypothetical protein
MNLIEFPEQTVVIAKDQPEYLPLPAFQFATDPTGRIACCWQLTWRERIKLLFTGKIWHVVMTFHHALQPQLLRLEKPFTVEDRLAADMEMKTSKKLRDFRAEMSAKYGEAVRKKTAKMDALNYHPNDRRRCVRFEPDDFRRAQEFGLLFIEGVRIVNDDRQSAV